MSDVRRPVVAGTFYPGSADVLSDAVDQLLDEAAAAAERPAVTPASVRGVVVPHAGYQYSGPVAATAYALLARLAPPPAVVVIIGPSHYEPVAGLAAAPHDAWATPLGEVPIEADVRRALLSRGAASEDRPHRAEHSIEVQLPFLQRCLPGVPILPVAVGFDAPHLGAELLGEALAAEALLVVSTDLSHYHDAATARVLDARTAATIEELAVEALDPADACGADALRVAMAWARLRGYRIRRLDLRNSADTAGDPARVVGYGAFAIVEGSSPPAATSPMSFS